MTYKLNPRLEKIISPIVLIFPDGSKREYASGSAVAEAVFDRKYNIFSLCARESKVEITLEEVTAVDSTWIGEVQTFF